MTAIKTLLLEVNALLKKGVIHGDVKPENLMIYIDQHGYWHMFLCDYDNCQPIPGDGGQIGICGSVGYAPKGRDGKGDAQRINLFQVAATVAAILTRCDPSSCGDALELLKNTPAAGLVELITQVLLDKELQSTVFPSFQELLNNVPAKDEIEAYMAALEE